MAPDERDRGFTVTDRRSAVSDSDAEKAGDPQAAAAADGSASRDVGRGGAAALPEIDFSTFVMSLGSSALAQLGELQMPDEGPIEPNLPLAKQTIDILGMLTDKTRGNLSSDEAQLLQHLLYDLRLKYVEARKAGR